MRQTLKEGGPALRLHRFHCYRTAALNFNNITVTTIPLDTIRAGGDPMGLLSADGGLVIPVTGIWDIAASVGFAANATGVRGVWVASNGATMNQAEAQAGASAGDNTIINIPFSGILLAKGDKITIAGYQASGGVLALLAGAYTFLAARLVTAT